MSGNDISRYLAQNLDMERQIHEITAVCDYVQGVLKSPKRLWLSFDEWNVCYRAHGGLFSNGQRKAAPHLLEEEYNLEDALVVGGFVNTLLRRSDRVRLACIAQIVNVIAPLMIHAEQTIRQTIYYPLRLGASVCAGPRARSSRWDAKTYPNQGRRARPRLRPQMKTCQSSTSWPHTIHRTAKCRSSC